MMIILATLSLQTRSEILGDTPLWNETETEFNETEFNETEYNSTLSKGRCEGTARSMVHCPSQPGQDASYAFLQSWCKSWCGQTCGAGELPTIFTSLALPAAPGGFGSSCVCYKPNGDNKSSIGKQILGACNYLTPGGDNISGSCSRALWKSPTVHYNFLSMDYGFDVPYNNATLQAVERISEDSVWQTKSCLGYGLPVQDMIKAPCYKSEAGYPKSPKECTCPAMKKNFSEKCKSLSMKSRACALDYTFMRPAGTVWRANSYQHVCFPEDCAYKDILALVYWMEHAYDQDAQNKVSHINVPRSCGGEGKKGSSAGVSASTIAIVVFVLIGAAAIGGLIMKRKSSGQPLFTCPSLCSCIGGDSSDAWSAQLSGGTGTESKKKGLIADWAGNSRQADL